MARTRGYPPEVKAAVLAEVDDGGKVPEVALRHGVSQAIVYRWLQQRRGIKDPVAPPPIGSFHARTRIARTRIEVDLQPGLLNIGICVSGREDLEALYALVAEALAALLEATHADD